MAVWIFATLQLEVLGLEVGDNEVESAVDPQWGPLITMLTERFPAVVVLPE